MISIKQARIAVVGAGAVGCYYGGLLAHQGARVRFLMRADLEAVRRHGLTIKTRGETHVLPVEAFATSAEIGACDLVIIALKATDNEALVHILPPLLGPGTALLTLQNGLGNEEFLASHWGAERVWGGLCFVCLNRVAPGVIEHYDHGTLSLGEFWRAPSDRLRDLAEAFHGAGVETRVAESLMGERWRKLVWNIPFNGLAIAAGGVNVAEVLASSELRALARRLMGEVVDAANRLGHAIPASFADYQIERSWSMGSYQPSSLIDWKLGRPVEVEAIWGEPWRQGTAAAAEMGRVETLYRLLQHLARRP
jgi:2-dehydropantoate 2-reductase